MIGLFDSGVGGLSVLKAMAENDIRNDFLYFGDTKNVPYGTKSKEEILSYTRNIMKFFIEKGVDTAVMACNTSSALVYEDLKREFSSEITIFPLIQSVAPFFKDETCTLGVLATDGTVKSHAYSKEITKLNPKIDVVEISSQNFVEIVEKRLYDTPKSLEYIKEKCDFLKKAHCKKVILGCTHFPYLKPVLEKFAPEIEFIDPAKYLILAMKNFFKKHPKPNYKEGFSNLNSEKTASTFTFCVSKDPKSFKESGSIFFKIENDPVLVNFEKAPAQIL